MNPPMKSPQIPNPERGAVLVIVAISLVVLVGFVALGVDLGYFFVTRNELQNVSDGSALAGTRTLGNIYQGLSNEQQQGFDCSTTIGSTTCADSVRAMAIEVAAENRAGGVDMSVPVGDVAIGQWDGNTFTPTLQLPDAVQVVTRRDAVANGPINTFFARVLGIDQGSVTAIATAALSGLGQTSEGEVELPIGISRWFFDRSPNEAFCNTDIQFYPSNDPASCAGWTSWEYGSNDITLRRILDENPAYDSPRTIANETYFNFTGGTLSNPTFDALLSLFQRKGFDVHANGDYILINPLGDDVPANRYHDATGHGGVPFMELDKKGNWVQGKYPDGTLRNLHKWETTLPVYDRGDCSNPNQSILIVGFAEIELTDVLNSPDKLVRGRVKCNIVDDFDSRGGGGEYGIKGSIPGLVR